MIKNITHRTEFGTWLNNNNLKGFGVEVGCAFGGHARQILSKWEGKRLFMVDPWLLQDASVYREKIDNVPYDGWFMDCLRVCKDFSGRASLIRDFSVEAAKLFGPRVFDFVYIDGNHSAEAVTDDANAWFPKIRSGGVIAFHDFYDDTNPPHFCQVKSAITAWAKSKNLEFHVTDCSTCWITVP